VQNCVAAVVIVGMPTVVVLVQTGFLVPVLGEALLSEALLLQLVVVALSEKPLHPCLCPFVGALWRWWNECHNIIRWFYVIDSKPDHCCTQKVFGVVHGD